MRVSVLAIALAQGLALFALYRSVETDSWPSQSPPWSYPLWTLAIVLPLFLLLSLRHGNWRRVAASTALVGAALAVVAAYTGYQATPWNEFPSGTLLFTFVVSIAIACFKMLMYLQQFADRDALRYEVLFTNSWRNFLVTALAGIFVQVFWLVLVLWAALFNAIGVRFFGTLFAEDWFLFPTLSVAFGIAITIFRDLHRVIDTIARLLSALLKILLPLVVAVAVLFLAALPFTGLEALWSTRNGTLLLLSLLAVMLFFTNAVYQDGRETQPYGTWVHRLIFVGLCAMPVISVLAAYGLSLRIEQHGFSVLRGWAALTWLLLTLFAVGYVVGIVRRRARWTADLAKVNTAMGFVVLTALLLANSPVLDFRKIAVSSQLARVDAGALEPAQLDFRYFARQLARPGHLAIEEIKTRFADDPQVMAAIDAQNVRVVQSQEARRDRFWAELTCQPAPCAIPDDVRQLIDRSYGVSAGGMRTSVMYQVDLDDDGQRELLHVGAVASGELYVGQSEFFYLADGAWQRGSLIHAPGRYAFGDLDDFRVVAPRYNDIEVGGLRFRPNPSDAAVN
jgi:hypothetical protein